MRGGKGGEPEGVDEVGLVGSPVRKGGASGDTGRAELEMEGEKMKRGLCKKARRWRRRRGSKSWCETV